LQDVIGNLLASIGFYEMLANSLTTSNYIALSETLNEEFNVSMLNPLSQDLAVMRQSLLFSGLEAIAYNSNRKRSDLKLFEFGKTYHNFPSGREEHKHLSLFVSGNRTSEAWNSPVKPSDFFYTKGVIISLLDRLGFQKTKSNSIKSDLFSEGLSVSWAKNTLVEFGLVKKSILKHFDISQSVMYVDFKWDAILEGVKHQKIKFKDIPKHPAVRRDFALLLDNSVQFSDLEKIAKQSEKQLDKS